jgi:hypothetical protein
MVENKRKKFHDKDKYYRCTCCRSFVRSFVHSFWLDRMWLDIVFGCICVVNDDGVESVSHIVLLVLLISLAFNILYKIQSYEYLV